MNFLTYTHDSKPLKVGTLLLYFLMLSPLIYAQNQPISLEECHELARQHFPLLKTLGIIEKNNSLEQKNISTGFYPQISLQGQASYQSEVTQIPLQIPGVLVPMLDKEQFKAYAELSQRLIDGGMIKIQKRAQLNQQQEASQHLEIELYALKSRINQLYFGVLLLDQQLKQQALLLQDIQQGLTKIQTAIRNGIALKSNADVMQAELLKGQQISIEMRANRASYISMLSLYIHRELNENTVLSIPNTPTNLSPVIKRPELTLFDLQQENLHTQDELLLANNRPKLNFIAQGGLGRPGLNMLSNEVQGYYLLGFRMNIPLSGWYTLKNNQAKLDLKKQEIEVKKEVFLFHTQLEMTQHLAAIKKYQQLLSSDDQLIDLRSRIKNVALSQVEHGLITGNDFVKECNAENLARQQKAVHEIQLVMKQYELSTTKGSKND